MILTKGEDICDWWFQIGFLLLFVWKPGPFGINWKDWDIGRSAGDGCFAIRCPFFLLYLE